MAPGALAAPKASTSAPAAKPLLYEPLAKPVMAPAVVVVPLTAQVVPPTVA